MLLVYNHNNLHEILIIANCHFKKIYLKTLMITVTVIKLLNKLKASSIHIFSIVIRLIFCSLEDFYKWF